MKCAKHPEVDSVAYCGLCGRPMCAECKREVNGMLYCESCLAARLQSPVFGSQTGPNPGAALALGFIPGVGAIYNGQVVKAIVQVLIFGSLVALSHRAGSLGSIFGVGATAFYFYMLIDSYQTAKAKQLGQPVPEWFGLGEMRMNAPVGAALLIALGVLFLLDNFNIPVFPEIDKFWPVLLIVAGVLLLQRRLGGGQAHHQPPAGEAPGSTTAGPGGPSGPRNIHG